MQWLGGGLGIGEVEEEEWMNKVEVWREAVLKKAGGCTNEWGYSLPKSNRL